MTGYVKANDWPKRFEMPAGCQWRSMLPSGMHCEGCHALITVEGANVGMAGARDGFVSLFDPALVLELLSAHIVFACRRVWPSWNGGVA